VLLQSCVCSSDRQVHATLVWLAEQFEQDVHRDPTCCTELLTILNWEQLVKRSLCQNKKRCTIAMTSDFVSLQSRLFLAVLRHTHAPSHVLLISFFLVYVKTPLLPHDAARLVYVYRDACLVNDACTVAAEAMLSYVSKFPSLLQQLVDQGLLDVLSTRIDTEPGRCRHKSFSDVLLEMKVSDLLKCPDLLRRWSRILDGPELCRICQVLLPLVQSSAFWVGLQEQGILTLLYETLEKEDGPPCSHRGSLLVRMLEMRHATDDTCGCTEAVQRILQKPASSQQAISNNNRRVMSSLVNIDSSVFTQDQGKSAQALGSIQAPLPYALAAIKTLSVCGAWCDPFEVIRLAYLAVQVRSFGKDKNPACKEITPLMMMKVIHVIDLVVVETAHDESLALCLVSALSSLYHITYQMDPNNPPPSLETSGVRKLFMTMPVEQTPIALLELETELQLLFEEASAIKMCSVRKLAPRLMALYKHASDVHDEAMVDVLEDIIFQNKDVARILCDPAQLGLLDRIIKRAFRLAVFPRRSVNVIYCMDLSPAVGASWFVALMAWPHKLESHTSTALLRHAARFAAQLPARSWQACLIDNRLLDTIARQRLAEFAHTIVASEWLCVGTRAIDLARDSASAKQDAHTLAMTLIACFSNEMAPPKYDAIKHLSPEHTSHLARLRKFVTPVKKKADPPQAIHKRNEPIKVVALPSLVQTKSVQSDAQCARSDIKETVCAPACASVSASASASGSSASAAWVPVLNKRDRKQIEQAKRLSALVHSHPPAPPRSHSHAKPELAPKVAPVSHVPKMEVSSKPKLALNLGPWPSLSCFQRLSQALEKKEVEGGEEEQIEGHPSHPLEGQVDGEGEEDDEQPGAPPRA
jgi:hypothetical protein